MFHRSRARIVLAALVASALILVTIDFRGEGEEGGLDRLRGVTTTVLQPIQNGARWLVSPFSDVSENVGELFSLRSQNAALRERVEHLESRSRTRTDLERENRDLQALVAIDERTSLDTVAARVVALSPSNFEWTITIDAGSDAGVARDMPVINGDGLVGRVIQVTANSARVLLAIDPNFSAAARSARIGEVGTLDGRGGDPLLLSFLDPEAAVELGDEIVTSSYQGGVFPAGIPIGTITELPESQAPFTREARVNPFVDFTRLDHVLVVRTSQTEPIPPFESTEGIEFSRPDSEQSAESDEPAGGGEADDADGDGDTGDDADDGTGADADDGDGA